MRQQRACQGQGTGFAVGAPSQVGNGFQIDDVGKAYDAALERDIVRMTLGRHQGDQMLSFYMESPSGTWMECGWGGRLIEGTGRFEQALIEPKSGIWGHRVVEPTTGREFA